MGPSKVRNGAKRTFIDLRGVLEGISILELLFHHELLAINCDNRPAIDSRLAPQPHIATFLHEAAVDRRVTWFKDNAQRLLFSIAIVHCRFYVLPELLRGQSNGSALALGGAWPP